MCKVLSKISFTFKLQTFYYFYNIKLVSLFNSISKVNPFHPMGPFLAPKLIILFYLLMQFLYFKVLLWLFFMQNKMWIFIAIKSQLKLMYVDKHVIMHSSYGLTALMDKNPQNYIKSLRPGRARHLFVFSSLLNFT